MESESFLWYSNEFFQYRPRQVHVYEIEGRQYYTTHVTLDENSKPLFADTSLVARGNARYVRSIPRHIDFFPHRLRNLNTMPSYHFGIDFDEIESTFMVPVSVEIELPPTTNVLVIRAEILLQSESVEQCAICIENVETGAVVGKLACGHTFHHGCICKWVSVKPNCPYCRRAVCTL